MDDEENKLIKNTLGEFIPSTWDIMKKRLVGKRGIIFAERLLFFAGLGKLYDGELKVKVVGECFKVSSQRLIEIFEDFMNLGLIGKNTRINGYFYLIRTPEEKSKNEWEIEKYIELCRNFLKEVKPNNKSDR